MFSTGLLILTQPLHKISRLLPRVLSEVNRLVDKTAYIHIQPCAPARTETEGIKTSSTQFELCHVPFTSELRNIVRDLYVQNAKLCSKLDVRVLVGHVQNSDTTVKRYNFRDSCDVVLIDKNVKEEEKADLVSSLKHYFNISSSALPFTLLVNTDDSVNLEKEAKKQKLDDSAQEKCPDRVVLQQFPHTVLGGTFDRLHVGHKILLSEGCLLGTDKLTVGVTDGAMNNNKTLVELMEPTEKRIQVVKEFLMDVKPGMEHDVVPITDGFGPTVIDPDMDLIVLSQETKKGGEMINTERHKKGMKELQHYVIELVEDSCHNQYEENKISSSSERKRLLGTLYHPLKQKDLPRMPYVIGLTGGIASGKSSVCKRLEGLGACIVDCDKLGHKAYLKGTTGYEKVVEAFGSEIVGEDSEVNRKELGKIVFANKDKMQVLNNIVWSEIARLAKEQITEYAKAGQSVVVLDAAVLLEAGWDSMCREVWTCIVPPQEAIKRIVERNNLTEEQAKQRLSSQISNSERVEKSNVILCTLWEYQYTQQQVERAWELLTARMSTADLVAKSNM